jgi:hypothetical protein
LPDWPTDGVIVIDHTVFDSTRARFKFEIGSAMSFCMQSLVRVTHISDPLFAIPIEILYFATGSGQTVSLINYSI